MAFGVDDSPEIYGTRHKVSVLIEYKDLAVPIDVMINFMDKKQESKVIKLDEEIIEDVVEEPAEVVQTEPK